MYLSTYMMEDWRSMESLGFSNYEAERSGKVRKRSNQQVCFENKPKNYRYINLFLKPDIGRL